jgi:hypothetical protein
MPHAVQIETQAEQQGLAHLHGQTAARGTGRQLAFDRREDAFDQRAAAVEPVRKRPPHLRTHAAHTPGFLSPLGGDHASRSELLTNVAVIPRAVELGIGQHQPMRVCWHAVATTVGKFAQSFHGPRRALCDNRNC